MLSIIRSTLQPVNFVFRISALLFLILLNGCEPASSTDDPAHQKEATDSETEKEKRWVQFDKEGRLIYKTDDLGNRIPDFSNAGYGGGGVAIPEIDVKLTIEPIDGDNTEHIQNAIDQLSKLEPDSDGFRGALLLKKGRYEIDGTLSIQTSGIVLRGEGQDEKSGTILVASGSKKRNLIEVSGKGTHREIPETRRAITDSYVPVGAKSFSIEKSDGFEVGDKIAIYRPSTEEWISEIGMDAIPPRKDGLPVRQWKAGAYDFFYDRTITAINDNKIEIDSPVFNSFDEKFGGGHIFKYEFPGRIKQIGIEHLYGISEFAGKPEENDEEHGWIFIALDKIENGWIRNVTSRHFGFGLAHTGRRSKWITIQDSICLDPVSQIRGSRRYPFYLSGQLALVQRCFANQSRHDFGINSKVPGPNVFLDSHAEESHADSGPHHRWATGALFDNIRIPNHSIRIINRLNLGSGHGWAGANMVIWNSSAKQIAIQNPPTAQNWAIGNQADIRKSPFEGDEAYLASHGSRTTPESLYLAQLRERLGDQAVENISEMDIRAPIQITPNLWR